MPILAGDPAAVIPITGTGFPLMLKQLDGVRIGGLLCERVELIEPGRRLSCVGLRWLSPEEARNSSKGLDDGQGIIGSSWPGDGVWVEVGG